jgi:HEAT repeat protein
MQKMRDVKNRNKILVILFLAAGFLIASFAEAKDSVRLQAKVTEILAKFPAQSPVEKDALAAELLSLGSDGIQETCRRLVAPGTGDDSLARYALDAAAVSASRAGAEKDRRVFAEAVIESLDQVRYTEIKTFLISELQLMGKDESVKPLSKYLEDLRLCEPAARALVTIKTPKAEKALLKALEADSVANPIALIKALGEIRSRAAVKKISVYAESRDEKTRRVALYALANIGDPASQAALERIPVTASPYERTSSASLYLLYAQRLTESGRKEQAFKIGHDLIRNFTAPGESQVRAAALTLLSGIVGESVLEDLLQAVESPDPKYRQRALELAEPIRGEQTTARWIEKMTKVPPENQADIISMLGRRGDKSAYPVIKEKLNSEEKAVRLAAIPAAVRLGASDIIDDLIPLLLKGEEDEVGAVKLGLLGFPSEIIVPKVAGLLAEAPPPACPALIEILAERKARDYVDVVLAQAKSENDTVRHSALAALGQIVRDRDLPQVINLLLQTANSSEIPLIQNAIVSAANQILDPERRADQVLIALEKVRGAKRANLLRPLARIGGEIALQTVIVATKNGDPQVRSVAIYALSNWPDSGAIEELFNIARTAEDRKFRYLALQGIARLDGVSALSPEKRLALLREAMDLAKETGEKNLLLTGMANIRTLESLTTVAAFLDDPQLQARAAQATAKIALPAPGAEGLFGFDAILILKKAALLIENEYDRENVENYVQTLLMKEGFVPLFNRKNIAGWKGLVGDPVSRAKMTPKKLSEEQKKADREMRLHWKVIDGMLAFDGKGHSLCTAKDYADFEMFVDWKIEEKGDSGIYLRGSPQVQIWDPAQWPEGSGGLYNNKIGPSKPLLPVDRPVGEWNSFYIKMIGERVTVYLNGVLVVDNVVLENYWERDKPIYPAGQIELQAHSTPLDFKNIYIREIAPEKK